MLSASPNAGASSLKAQQRSIVLLLFHLLWTVFNHAGVASAAPLSIRAASPDEPSAPDNPQTWIYLGTAIGLVLLGGALAGLTIA